MTPTTNYSVLTVSQLGELVGEGLQTFFSGSLWVEGQVSNLHAARSGHAYFDLVEPSDEPGQAPRAIFNVAAWRGTRIEVERTLAEAGSLPLADDLIIRLKARLEFYAPRGRLQLIMEGIDAGFTLGRLAVERERLLQALAEAGLLDRNAGLPVPEPPLRVGLVTSIGSAAYADFSTELGQSGLAFTLVEYDTRVQGDGVANQIAKGLRVIATHRPDVIALIRGGGSAADLAAFNAEVVARTIAELDVPVWTGIGHEIDRSIADETAHTAFKTPTACAAALVERGQAFASLVKATQSRIVDRAKTMAEKSAKQQSDLAGRTARAGRIALIRQGERLASITNRLRALDPEHVLARGWSITRLENGRLLRSMNDVSPGDKLTTSVTDGTVTSTVGGGRL